MKDANSLRGEERRVISTKLYRPEFVNFMKLCEDENKSVHAKLREMIGEEIKKNFGDIFTELQKKVPISKPDKEQADFKYQFSGEFDPTFSPIDMKEYEKKKYLEGILPKIEKLGSFTLNLIKTEINPPVKKSNPIKIIAI